MMAAKTKLTRRTLADEAMMGAQLSWKRDAELRRNFRELESSSSPDAQFTYPMMSCHGIGSL